MKTCRCGQRALYLFESDLRPVYKPCGIVELGDYADILCPDCHAKARLQQWLNIECYRSEILSDV